MLRRSGATTAVRSGQPDCGQPNSSASRTTMVRPLDKARFVASVTIGDPGPW
ncbi:MAG: hypothetical protein ACRDZO_16505 [Egibacteraceae bacterium]